MGTEDWVCEGTKLITNTKKQRLKGWIFKNTILKKRKSQNYKKYIYMKFAFKNRVSFFCKVIVGHKNEN